MDGATTVTSPTFNRTHGGGTDFFVDGNLSVAAPAVLAISATGAYGSGYGGVGVGRRLPPRQDPRLSYLRHRCHSAVFGTTFPPNGAYFFSVRGKTGSSGFYARRHVGPTHEVAVTFSVGVSAGTCSPPASALAGGTSPGPTGSR